MLILASQRIESVIGLWMGQDISEHEPAPTKRGAAPTIVEWFILAWVSGLIWSEVKQLWDVGLEEYANDMWNVIDFVTNSLYVATVALRIVAYYRVQKENEAQTGTIIELQREQWDTWDPMLISEGLFSAANIFRSLGIYFEQFIFFIRKLQELLLIVSLYLTLLGNSMHSMMRWKLLKPFRLSLCLRVLIPQMEGILG